MEFLEANFYIEICFDFLRIGPVGKRELGTNLKGKNLHVTQDKMRGLLIHVLQNRATF